MFDLAWISDNHKSEELEPSATIKLYDSRICEPDLTIDIQLPSELSVVTLYLNKYCTDPRSDNWPWPCQAQTKTSTDSQVTWLRTDSNAVERAFYSQAVTRGGRAPKVVSYLVGAPRMWARPLEKWSQNSVVRSQTLNASMVATEKRFKA